MLACFLVGGCVVARPPEDRRQAGPSLEVARPPAPTAAPAPAVIAPPASVLSDDEIVAQYREQLGRNPSPEEFREWHERVRQRFYTSIDLRNEIRGSQAFRDRDVTAIVLRAYHENFGADPDHEALRYYRCRLIDDGWSATEVIRSVARGDHPVRRDAANRGGQSHITGRPRDRSPMHDHLRPESEALTPYAIVERAYDDLLEREPDEAGRSRYVQQLQSGASEQQIRARIKQSLEYRVTVQDAKTTRAYRAVLGRDPDASGMETYRRKLADQGWTETDVENSLRQSSEYKNRHR